MQPEAGFRFAHRTFQTRSSSSDPPSHHSISAFFALHSYCSRSPGDAFAYHLFGLVNESLEKLELAERLVEKATSLLEAEYEDTEDPIIEQQFVLANSNLARLRLARQDLTGATDSFQNVLGLLTGDDTIKLRIHAHLGFGLAKFLSLEIGSALESFQSALDYARDDPLMRSHAIVLLSQAMWAIGSEDFRETAKSQLLQWCV
jgi:superkiller protein 3